MSNKIIEFNKRMIGKRILVVSGEYEGPAKIVEVIDEENFLVQAKDSQKFEVSMFDIRSLENA
jgi:hypothetical protein